MTPIVSILIPSRNRLKLLSSAIESWKIKASNPDAVEIIVRVHLDDFKTMEYVAGHPHGIQVIAGDNMDGHLSMGEFINCMAACSSGDWLMPASDDFECLTEGWENVLKAACDNPRQKCLLRHFTTLNKENERPPIMTRAFYQAIGSFGYTSHCDVYVDKLSWQCGINQMEALPVKVLNRLGPPPASGIWEAGHARFMSEEVQQWYQNDTRKLKLFI